MSLLIDAVTDQLNPNPHKIDYRYTLGPLTEIAPLPTPS